MYILYVCLCTIINFVYHLICSDIIANESLQNNGGVEENCNNLYLDHQKMLFGVQFITLAVKGSDTNCNILNVASSLDCRFNISEDTTQSTIDSVITLNESYALTNYSYYFDLSRQNDEGDICQTALGILQIKNSGMHIFE